MRAVIIGGGYIGDYDYIRSKIRQDDYIICADHGYDHAVKLGVKPDIILGDFDSIESIPEDTDIIKYPVRKDFTDGELAVRHAVEKGYDDVLMLALTGDRLDHTIADILLLAMCKNGCMIDDNNELYLLRGRLEINGKMGCTLSILPINGDLEGVTTENLEYSLKDETLLFGKSRGVSNVITADKCAITARSGMGLVIIIRKENPT